ncbi:MAG TPA: tRNA (N6-threonylcarbamoyladenosine(37)-N6)-methyltransferase TrmO [Syntrophobacteraceae bacterium]|nr:tRNA (N6-threonylcarbamoyladenosine(37)-N6)-methyltransferase TrmO [Syntrophobacteraceae bacterium]
MKDNGESTPEIILRPIGIIRSPIAHPGEGPRQGSESGVAGKLIVDEQYRDALLGLQRGDRIVILYWMHLAERDMLQVHPRGDRSRPLRGVFTTRSPQRPNPISVDTVEVTGIQNTIIDVVGLDAVDGTPLLDIKCTP